jgi:hypothetical protein
LTKKRLLVTACRHALKHFSTTGRVVSTAGVGAEVAHAWRVNSFAGNLTRAGLVRGLSAERLAFGLVSRAAIRVKVLAIRRHRFLLLIFSTALTVLKRSA